MPRVSVVVINYNGRDIVVDCLKALAKQVFRDFELIVVDNGSTDNSAGEIRNFLKSSLLTDPIKTMFLDDNLGFAGGNLAGLSRASDETEYVALLNNDAEADATWLENLVSEMEVHPEVGICASKLLVYGTDRIDSAGDGYSTSLKGFKRGEGEDKRRYDIQEYVFGACAGAALYRKKMLEEIGFFDEDFFLIHEDTDLNFRAQLSGWKVLYVPSAVVHHKVRSSIGHMSDIAVYYSVRNSDLVRIKNIPLPLFLRCLPDFIIGAIADFLSLAVKRRKLKQYLRAKADVVRSLGKTLRKRRDIMAKIRKVDDRYLLGIMSAIWSKSLRETIRK